MFKVTARDQGHYKGPSGAFVTYCNISCFFVFFCVCVGGGAGLKIQHLAFLHRRTSFSDELFLICSIPDKDCQVDYRRDG